MAAAEAAHDEGRLDDAIAIYEQLAQMDASDPTWGSRIAEICRAKKDRPGRVKGLCMAAYAFAASGVPMKGIAMAKLALSLDRENADTKALFEALSRGELPTLPEPVDEPTPIPVIKGEPLPDAEAESEDDELDDLFGEDVDISVLPPIALFASVGEEAFQRLLETAELHDFEAGHTIFEKGDAASSMFVIAEGAVDVILEAGEAAVAKLASGDFFGEMGLFARGKGGAKRGATIVTAEPTQVLELPLEVLSELIQADPNILKVVLRVFGERLIENALRKAPLFADLSPADRKDLGARFRPTNVRKGTVLIEQGCVASGLFIAIQGELEVRRGEEVVAELGSGALFGEISVLTGLPATATVAASRKCLLLSLPAAAFQEVAAAHPELMTHAARLASERMPDA